MTQTLHFRIQMKSTFADVDDYKSQYLNLLTSNLKTNAHGSEIAIPMYLANYRFNELLPLTHTHTHTHTHTYIHT